MPRREPASKEGDNLTKQKVKREANEEGLSLADSENPRLGGSDSTGSEEAHPSPVITF